MTTAPQPIGTIQKRWNKEAVTTNTTQNNYFDFIASTPGNPPTTDVSTGIGRNIASDSGEFNQVKAMFYGAGTAGSSAATIRIWGVSRVQVSGVDKVDYPGELLGEATVTAGSGTGTSGGEFGTGVLFADAIEVVTDSSNRPPGMRVTGDIDNKAASLMIDAVGYEYIIIEIVKGTWTNIGVVWRVL